MSRDLPTDIPEEFKKEIRSDYIRMVIFGSGKSGKTHALTEFVIKAIHDQYDSFIVFTRSHNKPVYQMIFKKIKKPVQIIIKDFRTNLKRVRALQEKNETTDTDPLGNPIYASNVLIIWDDILNKKLLASEEFLDQFSNMRHLQISTIMLTQVVNDVVTTGIKSNCNFTMIFKVKDLYQRREMINMISESIEDDENFKSIKNKATKIYNDEIRRRKFGFVCLNEAGDIFFPN